MTQALEALRNVAFVGHPSSGKTTLVDALAHLLGASSRKGSVADKTSICDTEPEEQDKQHTLQLAVVQTEKDGKLYTLMDTPGYPDFISDVNAAVYASDLVVGVVSCSSGVSFNVRKKLESAAKAGRGRAIVVTHVDGDNASFDDLVEELRSKIGEVCVPFTVPNASGGGFNDSVSILSNKDSDWHRRLMDRTMDGCEDETILEHYLETEELTDEELHKWIPTAIAKGALVPVLAVNPDSGVAVEDVVTFLREFAPHPGLYEYQDAEGNTLELDPEKELVASVFNVKSDPHVGKICLAKIFRGTLGASDPVIGPDSPDRGEKLGGLFRMVGKKRDAIEVGKPGEIVAFAKVEQIQVGQPFTKAGSQLTQLPEIEQPLPMVSVAVVPKSRADEQKIGESFAKLCAEDPTFSTEVRSDTREMVMSGMSDLHLQVMESRLKRRYGVEIETSIPRVPYKETITKAAEGHHRHKKQSGGRGQFGECYVRVKPNEKGAGVTFTDKIVGGSIPRNLIPAVEKGMRETCAKGVLTSSEVVDLDFEVYDGKYHDVDSDEASFKMAGARAFIDGFKKANPVLLEPVVELTIYVPTEAAGQVFSDITSQRRGQVLDQWTEDDGAVTVVKAQAPLATVQTYQRDLKSQTSGEGHYAMKMVDYAAVPNQEQQKILAQIGQKHEEE